MTRGNQREKSREKNMKKQKDRQKASGDKGANKGKTLEERRHRDAEIMRQKQMKKGDEDEDGAVGGATK